MADDEALVARLKEAGEDIKQRAAEKAQWSRRVPASLEVKVEGESVIIVADATIAPQARAFELGIRHPLNYPTQTGATHEHDYQRHFARTPKRPFLEDALAERTDIAMRTIANVVYDWAIERGWRYGS